MCYDTRNYGSQLQIIATIKTIEGLGLYPEIIRYRKKITPCFIIQTLPRLFNYSFVISKLKRNNRDKKAAKYPKVFERIVARNNLFDRFAEQYFHDFSPVFEGWENLVKESARRYDLFLCGSDQLWLPNNLGSHFYTLEYAPDDKPKISYATSFGVSKIPFFQRNSTSRFLKRFSSLSTREKTGVRIIKELTNIEAALVCDPTLLLTQEEWGEMIHNTPAIEPPYIFCYFLGSNLDHRTAAEALKEATGYNLVTIPFLDDFMESDLNFGDIQLYDIDSIGFMDLIRHASFVLTDSYHGTIFSILFQKKFLTFDRFGEEKNSRNNRIDSLFSVLKLEDRRYRGDVMIIESSIDYDRVSLILDDIRQNSYGYLKNALVI